MSIDEQDDEDIEELRSLVSSDLGQYMSEDEAYQLLKSVDFNVKAAFKLMFEKYEKN